MTDSMRIAQVVTYISRDGAFGGPVAVALAQSEALAAAGHSVHLYAAWDGVARIECPGVELHLFTTRRRRRLALIVSPRLVIALFRSRRRYDAIHLHFGRDLVSVGAWLAVSGRADRVVVQTHGMIRPSARAVLRGIDAVSTRRALSRSRAALALTPSERDDLLRVTGGAAPVRQIRNALGVDPAVGFDRPAPRTVLFLARLHRRKNVLLFAEMARRLVEQGVDGRFLVIGPDEGDLATLRAFIAHHELAGRLDYGGTTEPGGARALLRTASVLVLPSVGEVFPMTVLEGLAVGTPVVLSEDCGLSRELLAASAADVCPPDAASFTRAVGRLITEEDERIALARRGFEYAQTHFSIEAVRADLERLYSSSAGRTAA